MPEDMDIYMKKIKQRADETENVMGKIKESKMAELDKIQIDTAIAEAEAKLEENRAKIRESRQTGQAVEPQQAYNFAELLFAGRPPEEIKQIISTLTQEEIQKLAYMASAMNNSKLTELREFMRQPSTGVKEVVDAMKVAVEIAKPQQQPQGTISDIAKSMAEMFKTGVEVGRGQAQTQQPQDPIQVYKVVTEMVRPFQEEARAREKEANELRMRQLESKIVDPLTYIKGIKSAASDLGFSSGGKSEVDLKLEEMRQTREVEMKRVEMEEEDRRYKREHEGDAIETVKEVVKIVSEGPIGKAIENIGGGAADRIRSGRGNTTSLIKAQCPNCNGQFMVNPALPTVQCNSCGAVLSAVKAPTQPQPQPETSSRQPETPQPTPEPQPEATPQVTSETQPEHVEDAQPTA